MNNSDALSLQDCMFSALVFHFLSHLNSEAIYIERLRKNEPDPDAIKAMMVEFRVWRTVDAEKRAQISKSLPRLTHTLSSHGWPDAIEKTHNWGHKKKSGSGFKSFASGLSKLLWFSGGHKLPMFDVYTAVALKTKGKTKTEQLLSFVNLHTDSDFEKMRCSIQLQLDQRNLSWCASAERIIDKALLIRGWEASASTTPLTDAGTVKRYRRTLGALHGFDELAEEITATVQESVYGKYLSTEFQK